MTTVESTTTPMEENNTDMASSLPALIEDDSSMASSSSTTSSTLSSSPPSSAHVHFAGRTPAGSAQPVTLSKNGVRHVRLLPTGEAKEVLSIGLACSEIFSGPRLAKVLKPGFEYERKIMENLMAGSPASPLSIHTSSGVPAALSDFIGALEPHLPWKNDESAEDWCMSLQLEGASAVWAAVDMLLQVQIISTGNKHRKMVAVGANSYHGPPSTSFGGKSPLWQKTYQVKYPVPTPGSGDVDEAKLLGEFEAFLNKHGDDVGVLLVEPQWGSSQAAYPWPKTLLRQYVSMAQSRGILVCADEIMCGLGRHGHGTMFLSEAWDLNPDAVTFGKAIAGGVFPLSGAVLKRGGDVLSAVGRTVMQSHTFSGSSARSLMTGAEVLKELTQWLPAVTKLGEDMKTIFNYLSVISDGMLIAHGQGLMWGCLFNRDGLHREDGALEETLACFRKHCEDVGVLPYFIPVGGFMVTPVIDVEVATIYEIGMKLEEAIKRTVNERGWVSVPSMSTTALNKEEFAVVSQLKDPTVSMSGVLCSSLCSSKIQPQISCTSCMRMRFSRVAPA